MTMSYRRILVKLSGEALQAPDGFWLDAQTLANLAEDVARSTRAGFEIALVIGGGNIIRGARMSAAGWIDRPTADSMGMLATVMNSLAMQDALEGHGIFARVMSALRINEVCEDYIRRRAVRHLEKGRVVIFAAGTGNPFFTTDSAASLRAIEIGADLLLKATKVDGVYSADPHKNPNATRYSTLSYDQVLADKLEIMDATAIVLCRDYNVPLKIFDINRKGDLMKIMKGDEAVGTTVNNGVVA